MTKPSEGGIRPTSAQAARVRGVDYWLQLAAALDRRGITVKIDVNQVIVRIGRDNAPITIGYDNHLHPERWHWSYLGRDGTHPIGDFDGAAQAVEEFLRATPGLAGTELLHRMNHMGMTFQQETDEILARAKANGYTPGSPATPTSHPRTT